MISSEEKLKVIEHFVEQWRDARDGDDPGERQVYLTLKAVADDLRAQPKATDTIHRMDRAIRNAQDRKTSTGYATGNLREIAELTIGRWPTIRQALEKFE